MARKESSPLTYEQALTRATSLCSISEHSIQDIEAKFENWGLSQEDSDKGIDYLIQEKFIDESRFARAYTLDKLRYNHWGRVKIHMMLRQQGIQDKDIRSAFDEIPEDEYKDILSGILEQKERTLKEEDEYQKRGKLIRFALQRGFEMGEILDFLP